ncbi:MAG: DEAD/DEAH box helicase [Deltaproteobacteria bacterium]|nr:MAG: DEAD/DEAH box helicase [Deltaproteobacteria bacterium]
MHASFADHTRTWFTEAFPAPTRVQELGWPHLAEGRHALLLAPTGSGKTLAAFLAGLDALSKRDPEGPPGVRLLYVSPMKALAYDVERNLKAPLVGMARCAERLGTAFTPISMGVRTGDTPQRERQQMLRHPPDVLVTTPESLFLMLGSSARGFLETVETVIVDEIHAIAGTKRGVHLALTLERLADLTAKAGGHADGPQRIGLSATQRPLSRIAGYLGGGRPVEIVDTSEPPHIALSIQVAVADMDQPVAVGPVVAESAGQRVSTSSTTGQGPTRAIGGDGESLKPSIWPTIYPRILALIREHRTTIVFTNSRILCERLAQRLNELAGEELVRAHHGSVARHQREQIEEQLKAGLLPAIVATSTLELGIDMGTVDLVIQIEAPNSVASGLQRIGRAGHGVGELSEGVLFPKFKGDLLQSVVVAQAMAEGAIEETRLPKNCLDVLSQHLVSACATETWSPDALFAMVQRATPYADLPRASFEATLDMLAGRYPSDEFADLSPRLSWDRAKDELTARKGAGMLALMNAGTIPDRGLYGVFLGVDGPRIGELDEEMVHESRRGDVIILGASSWRVEELTRDKVIVSPAPGEPGRLPFWHGDRPGRPIDLGRRLGAFVREIDQQREGAADWLREHTPVDELAAKNLVDYIHAQREATGLVPHDQRIVVERFKDELGDWRICILSPFGAKVHAPWALALQSLLASRAAFDVQALYTDDGIVLRLADTEELPEDAWLWPEPEEVEDLVVEQLAHSSVFAARFRENAGRALLLPKRRPDKRSPLWAQRLKAQQLQAVAERFPSFPIILETYRECLSDVFDLDALKGLLADVRSRKIRVETVETRTASPFARSLVFAYVAAYMYEGDAPLAERRAQALTLDRGLLRELLGQEALRELLDADAVDEVEAELQALAEGRRCRDADHVHDLLRRLGDLTVLELAARSEEEPVTWLAELRAQRRAIPVHIAGEERWIAAEDAGRYLHGLGIAIAPGLPSAFMDEPERPLTSLFLRYARTHGPFHTQDLARRYALVPGAVAPILEGLEAEGHLIRGELRPGGTRAEWCHVEVLRRLKRRSLAKLRQEIEAVDSAVLARFLVDWHGITSTSRRSGPGRLRDALVQLEGLPISWHQLESEVLPARVPGYRPGMLDELAHTGEWVWVGAGPLGSKDGRVVLLQRERAPLFLGTPDPAALGEPSALHTAILDHLGTRGASFLTVLQGACGATTEELMPALWDLVWAGLVTNDGFLPLRSLRATRRSRSGPTRYAGGRWSLVAELVYREATPTEQAHARALTWLERYGVISRQVPRLEGVAGGFSSVYPLLRAMEEQGKARRGHFVEGLEGAQFALPGTVDRLRGHRDESGVDVVLAAADPANPYGALLPWGPCSRTPKRAVGAKVVLVDGRPALWVDKGAKRFLTLEAFGDAELAARAVAAWVAQFDRHKTLYVHKIDGEGAKDSRHARWFREAGFAEDYKGLIRVQ